MISKALVPIVTYNGNNVTKSWGITFPTFEAESLKIYLNLLIDGTEVAIVKDVDYTLADLNVNGVEASITLIDAGQAWINGLGGLDVQYSITVEFDSEAFQPAAFRTWTQSSPITLENTLDRAIMSIKALNYQMSLLNSVQTDANTAAIVIIQGQIGVIQADITAIEANILAIEAFLYSDDSVILDNVTNQPLGPTVDVAFHKHMILEYVAVRNGVTQYGRQLLVGNGAAFVMSPIEKVGDAGLSFTVTNAAGVGTVKYTTTNTGFAGVVDWSLYKFKV